MARTLDSSPVVTVNQSYLSVFRCVAQARVPDEATALFQGFLHIVGRRCPEIDSMQNFPTA